MSEQQGQGRALNNEVEENPAEKPHRLKRTQEDRGALRAITVNKRTHKIRFESETESEVTIVIEKRENQRG